MKILHIMKLLKYDDTGYEWGCDECGRTVKFGGSDGYKILVRGNDNFEEVTHQGSSGIQDLTYLEIKAGTQ